MNSMILIITMQALGFALVVLEAVVPSGGVIGVLAALALGYSWYEIIQIGNTSQIYTFIGIDVVGMIFSIWLGIKLFKKSPFINKVTLEEAHNFTLNETTKPEAGSIAKVVQPLKPVGYIEFNNNTYEAQSNDVFIEINEVVKIINIKDNTIIVEKTENQI